MRELPAGAMAVSAMHSCPLPDSPVREQTRTLCRSAIGFFERELEHETWRKDASPPVAGARHLKNWMACSTALSTCRVNRTMPIQFHLAKGCDRSDKGRATRLCETCEAKTEWMHSSVQIASRREQTGGRSLSIASRKSCTTTG